MENNGLATLPKVGETYHFFDDGKVGLSRQYYAQVSRVIPFEDGNGISFHFSYDNDNCNEYYDEGGFIEKTLIDIWKDCVENIDWVFADETDCFVECKIYGYDEHPIWFARKKDGGWFSMDIQSWWQSGFLDVDGLNDVFWKK